MATAARCPYHVERNLKRDDDGDITEPILNGPGDPIPQPPEHWIGGNTSDVDPSFFVSSVWSLAATYGPIFRLRLWNRSLLVVSSRELVDEVCDEKRFEKIPTGNLTTLRKLLGSGLFTAFTDEHEWYLAHRILMPAMGPVAVRRMFDQMVDCVSQMILKWDRLGPDHVISGPDDFSRLTFEVIGLTAMNHRFNCFYAEEMPKFCVAMADALIEAGKMANRMALENTLRVFSHRKFHEDVKYMKGVADHIIADRKANPRPDLQDLLNTMLYGKDPVSGEQMTDELIQNELITFLIAGHETTSGTMNFMLLNMLQNPHVLRKCQQEVDEVVGDSVLSLEHLPKLTYVWATLRETLRYLGPIGGFQRHSKRDTVLGGRYKIHPNEVILINLRGLHHNTASYGPDANVFRPERFLNGGWESLPPNAWKPFGTGARGCPGRAIAEQEMIIAWALMLQRFNFELADPSYKLKIKATLTMKPDNFNFKARHRPGKDRMVGLPGGSKVAPAASRTRRRKDSAVLVPESADLKPLALYYGGNTGTCKAYAEDMQTVAPNFGFDVPNGVCSLDEAVENLPTDKPVLIFAASYEGQPADNAKMFVAWLEGLAKTGNSDALTGVNFAIFGAGNSSWSSTFHRIPKLVEELMVKLGAKQILPPGLVDVSEDVLGPYEGWKDDLFPVMRELSGATAEVKMEALTVDVVQPEAPQKLAGQDMKAGLVLVNKEIAPCGPGPLKKHMEVLLPPGTTYSGGDYLVVLPFNPRSNIRRVMNRFGLHADDLLEVSGTNKEFLRGYDHSHITALELIGARVELATPASQRQVAMLAEKVPSNEKLKALAQDETTYREVVLEKRMSVLDLLDDFADCKLSLAEYVAMLQPLTARQYSISSSPLAYAPVMNPGVFGGSNRVDQADDSNTSLTCSITYDVLVDAPALSGHGRMFNGVASSYLSNLPAGSLLRCTVRPTNAKFHLPHDPKTPVIMIASGTGIAPMRAFIQERAAIAGARGASALGPAVLYYGCRDFERDFLYHDELVAWEAKGVVKVQAAFSKVAPPGVKTGHIDQVIWEQREEVKKLFVAGAKILVCGSARRLGQSIHDVCIRIWREAHPEATPEQGEAWLLQQKEDRYQSDVFG
ncbi:cytochrome P450 [Coniella lustricola]|uniref:Bifunctional cytochrome P450/NADPH--P450 reductase n=1 Tax=Coniella lustricola TaxID=2025994 RepID=A0A2T2ZTL4_9PEZI|nr:cytochrome P450 [Coniella lustricola]